MPKLTDHEPQSVWQYQTAGQVNPNPLVWAKGGLLYADNFPAGDGIDVPHSVLHLLDVSIATEHWAYKAGAIILTAPLVVNDVVYIGTDNNLLHAVKFATGEALWTFDAKAAVVSTPVGADGKILFGTQAGIFYAITTDGAEVWSYDTGRPLSNNVAPGFDAVVSDQTVLLASYEHGPDSSSTYIWLLSAFDLQTGAIKWQQDEGGNNIAPGLSVGDGRIYFRVNTPPSGNVMAVDIVSGETVWTFNAGAEFEAAPTFANGLVYFGTDNSDFSAVDAATGTFRWKISVGNNVLATQPVVGDGIAYFGTDGGTLYAVNLANEGADVLTYTVQSDIGVTPAVENGVVYFNYWAKESADPATIEAVNMGSILHEFSIESQLMVEDYDVSGQQEQPTATSFRTQISIVDEHKTPRANQAVKVWADEPLTIKVGGQSYDLDADAPALLQTDAAGELCIITEATTFNTPALNLWANFMLSEEAILVYPDHETLTTMSGVQADDLDPAHAQGYDKQPLLLLDYQSADQRDQIASAIRNTLGRQTTASVASAQSAGSGVSNKYIAFPEYMPDVAYIALRGAGGRSFVSGEVASWHLVIDQTQPGSPVKFVAEPEADVMAALFGAAANVGKHHLGFKDFVKNVVHGAEHAAEVAYSAVAGVVNAVIQTAENVYNFVVQTVEDAVAVVAGFLKSVVSDLKKLAEWLSYLFEWKDIVDTHDKIYTAVSSNLQDFKQWLDSQISAGVTDVKSFFQTIEGDAQGLVQQVITQLGDKPMAAQTDNNTLKVFSAGGAKSYTKSKWLHGKVMDNLGGADVSNLNSTATTLAGDPLLSAFMDFFDDAQQILTTQFSTLPAEVNDFFNNFQKLFTDPRQFVTHAFSDILQMMANLADMLLKFGAAIAEGFLKMLQAVVDLVIDKLTKPITIPFISELYQLIAHKPLSLLDLCALLVAVPTTIVSKALKAAKVEQPSLTATASDSDAPMLQLGLTFALAFYTVMDPIGDTLEPGPVFGGFFLGLSALLWGASYPRTDDQTPKLEVHDYLLFTLQFFPLITTAVGLYAPKGAFNPFPQLWQAAGPIINCAYGVGLDVAFCVYAYKWPERYLGDHYYSLIQNVFSAIPYIAKPLIRFGAPGKIGLAIADVVGDGGNMVMSSFPWLPSQRTA